MLGSFVTRVITQFELERSEWNGPRTRPLIVLDSKYYGHPLKHAPLMTSQEKLSNAYKTETDLRYADRQRHLRR